MDEWWSDVERDIMACLEGHGATPVAEVARRLAVSEDASLLALLAREGKVRIRVVEAPPT